MPCEAHKIVRPFQKNKRHSLVRSGNASSKLEINENASRRDSDAHSLSDGGDRRPTSYIVPGGSACRFAIGRMLRSMRRGVQVAA